MALAVIDITFDLKYSAGRKHSIFVALPTVVILITLCILGLRRRMQVQSTLYKTTNDSKSIEGRIKNDFIFPLINMKFRRDSRNVSKDAGPVEPVPKQSIDRTQSGSSSNLSRSSSRRMSDRILSFFGSRESDENRVPSVDLTNSPGSTRSKRVSTALAELFTRDSDVIRAPDVDANDQVIENVENPLCK